jgi:hypothetical protein
MNNEQAMAVIHEHTDPVVREAAEVLNASNKRRKNMLNLIREALGQLRLDLKYMAFDLEATRRERDVLRGPV